MKRIIPLVLLVSSLAHAQPRISGLPRLAVPPRLKAPADVIPLPRLTVAISAEASGLRAGDFRVQLADNPALGFPADRVVSFRDSDEPLAMIILVDGKVRFIGDPEPEPIEGETTATPIPGAWEEIHGALDVLGKARARKTRVALWVYGETVVPKTELGEPGQVGGEALGARIDYAKIRTSALRLALESAQSRLAQEPGRRVIVVIGDGTDTVTDVDYGRVAAALSSSSIELHMIVARSGGQAIDPRTFSRLGRLVSKTGGRIYRAEALTELPQLAENLVASLDNLYTVEFALASLASGEKFPFDEAAYDLTVKVKDQEVGLTLPLPYWDFPPIPPPEGGPLWPWVLLGGIAVAMLITTVVVMRPRRDEEEEEGLGPQASDLRPPDPAPEPEARGLSPEAFSRPEAFLHTQEIDLNAMPIVGWVVPLCGPNAYRTYKLRSSGTSLIGTAPGCDVLIVDPYVSHEHAEIVADGGNFRLRDRGSRNGVKVGEARVTSHDLVDNEVFTVGQTEMVFKSIN